MLHIAVVTLAIFTFFFSLKRIVRFVMQRICPLVDRWFLFGCGFQWIKTVGQPFSVTKAPIVIGGPHSSIFDMFILALYGMPSFVTRGENKHIPVYGSE